MSAFGGGFNRSLQHHSIGRSFKSQGLPRALIEPQRDLVEVRLAVDGSEPQIDRGSMASTCVPTELTKLLLLLSRTGAGAPQAVVGRKGDMAIYVA